MNSSEKTNLTRIGNIDYFNKAIKSLTLNLELSTKQKSYLLSCALMFLRYFHADKRYTSYAEIAYYIILKYSVSYEDYRPLYDFSISFGFYPIAKFILDQKLVESSSINECIVNIGLDEFQYSGYTETLEQKLNRVEVLKSSKDEICYIAPTSFGKSSLIVDFIKRDYNVKKAAIIVPTKSLLMQTYRLMRNSIKNTKIIIHDDMYSNEKSFIGVLTQERAYRLIKNHGVIFDELYIDEAHNLFKRDSRNILLSRLIRVSKKNNSNLKVLYLSPLISSASNLSFNKGDSISEQKIEFNIKEPEVYEYCEEGVYQYNRFVNKFYLKDKSKVKSDYINYILQNSKGKSFLYIRSPRKIELLSKSLSYSLKEINTEDICKTVEILKKYVHERFYANEFMKKGVIYLHGKLPDIIKEYLELKFNELDGIRYLVANTVILEGMNLPINTLFILNTYSLNEKELKNLIGRVNRLNTIFDYKTGNLESLLPAIHFINNQDYGNLHMRNKITKLRSNVFCDVIENPILKNFDVSKEKDKKKLKLIKNIIENENYILVDAKSDNEKMKKYLIQENIAEYYSDIDYITVELSRRILKLKDKLFRWNRLTMMEKIYVLFIRKIQYLTDFELSRLKEKAARNFYENHIKRKHTGTLKENINSMYYYFKERQKSDNSIFYIGASYGEISRESTVYTKENHMPVNVDLRKKDDQELINLAIVKLKLEDDFVSFKINKLIIMLFDYNLISVDDYNTYIYGTTDIKKIDLYRLGLSGSLINKLENDGQLRNVSFDTYGNIETNDEFEEFRTSVDDFYKFEIDRSL